MKDENYSDLPVWEKTFIALRYLFEATRENQKAYREVCTHNDTKAWLNEWCTIRFNGARRIGHSSAIFRLLSEYELKSVIFYPNSSMAKRFGIMEREYVSKGFIKTESIYYLSTRGFDFTNIDAIVLECSFFIPKKFEEGLKDIILSSNIMKRDFFFFYL